VIGRAVVMLATIAVGTRCPDGLFANLMEGLVGLKTFIKFFVEKRKGAAASSAYFLSG
jgi:hypothetical protein